MNNLTLVKFDPRFVIDLGVRRLEKQKLDSSKSVLFKREIKSSVSPRDKSSPTDVTSLSEYRELQVISSQVKAKFNAEKFLMDSLTSDRALRNGERLCVLVSESGKIISEHVLINPELKTNVQTLAWYFCDMGYLPFDGDYEFVHEVSPAQTDAWNIYEVSSGKRVFAGYLAERSPDFKEIQESEPDNSPPDPPRAA